MSAVFADCPDSVPSINLDKFMLLWWEAGHGHRFLAVSVYHSIATDFTVSEWQYENFTSWCADLKKTPDFNSATLGALCFRNWQVLYEEFGFKKLLSFECNVVDGLDSRYETCLPRILPSSAIASLNLCFAASSCWLWLKHFAKLCRNRNKTMDNKQKGSSNKRMRFKGGNRRFWRQ